MHWLSLVTQLRWGHRGNENNFHEKYGNHLTRTNPTKKKDKTELEQGQMSISQKRTHTSVQWPWHSISAALIRDGSLKMMRRAQRLEGLASVGDQSQIRLLSPRGFVQSRVVAIAWNEKKKSLEIPSATRFAGCDLWTQWKGIFFKLYADLEKLIQIKMYFQ